MSAFSHDAKSFFLNALDRPVAEREKYLNEICEGNAALRADVQELLDAHKQAAGFLMGEQKAENHSQEFADSAHFAGSETVEWTGVGTTTFTDHGPNTPALVLAGRYTVLRPIGEGGMGTVWIAQQTAPVKRMVAVKLIRAGMDSASVLARFEAERQALAIMDHPNIAKVLDGGVAPDGRPFFIMELVEGVPITDFCDERRLTPRQRLELFIPVCEAVQHAHQKGVIHRDVKPSNVLVTLYEGRPVPKVIDFGVAKAAGAELAEQTFQTGPGMVVGTPAYMAPEQADLGNRDIDTRVDVYGLGALLYELLAGSPPFTRAQLHRAGLLEMLRVVREEELIRPSDRLSTADTLPSLAAARGTETRRLTRILRSDLDWVVMKALEKDRIRRYPTATGLAEDVRRYLAGEPVQAAPPTLRYRMRKFVRRNRNAIVTVAAVALIAVTGATGTAIGIVRAEREKASIAREAADKARTLTEMLQHLLETADPEAANGPEYTVSQMLYDYEATLDDKLKNQPEIEADLRSTIGQAYVSLLKNDRAITQFEKVIALRRAALGPDHPKLAEALSLLASAWVNSSTGWDRDLKLDEYLQRAARARPLAEEAVTILRRVGEGSEEALAHALITYGLAIWARRSDALPGRNAQAVAAFREGIEIAQRYPGNRQNRLLAQAHCLLSEHYRVFEDNVSEALAHAQLALELFQKDRGDWHINSAGARINLGDCYLMDHDYPRAEEQYRQTLAVSRKIFANRPNAMSSIALKQLVFTLAMQYKDESVESELQACPPEWHAQSFQFHKGALIPGAWGEACYLRGDYDEAVRHFHDSLIAWKDSPGEFRETVEHDIPLELASALLLQDKFTEARAELKDLLAIAQIAAKAPTNIDRAQGLSMRFFHARVLMIAGAKQPDDLRDAIKMTGSLEQLAIVSADKDPFARFTNLAARHFLHDHVPVVKYLPDILNSTKPWDLVERRFMEKVLAESLEEMEPSNLRGAEQVHRQAVTYCEEKLPKGHPDIAIRRVLLAEFLNRQKRYEEAVKEFHSAFEILSSHPQASGRSLTQRRNDIASRMTTMFAAWEKINPNKAAEWRAKSPFPVAPVPRLKT